MGLNDAAGLFAGAGDLVAGDAVGGRWLWRNETDLLEELLQRQGDFLFAREGVALLEDVWQDGGEPIQRDAGAATGDFLGQFLDRKADLRSGIMRPWFEEMGWDARQDIAEAKNDLLLLLARF